ncbi:MAG TPA: hypothetical protein VGW35_19370 [Methylomirabilota bacterium]|jgi:hypothetical protein|nr:hypothetical protein [Methylomirabilota bacterium]
MPAVPPPELPKDAWLIGGLGRGGNAHGVDEFVTSDGMRRFAVSRCRWLHDTARG